MSARMRWMWGLVVVGVAVSGCSSTCCSWFGRNSDCSHNGWGHKPTPVQPGPIAGTFNQPGQGGSTMTVVPQGSSVMTPLPNGTSSTPAGQQPSTPVITLPPTGAGMPASPLNTPPGTAASFQQLPPAELKVQPPGVGSVQTGEGTPPPQVQPPSIDLSVPGVGSGKKPEMNEVLNRPSAMPPIILAPSDSNRSVRAVDASVSPTVTAPVQSSAPTIPGPDIMPRGTATPGLPNASTAAPPPVPPVPTPPTLHLK